MDSHDDWEEKHMGKMPLSGVELLELLVLGVKVALWSGSCTEGDSVIRGAS